jgi:membrane associated rhomboid family serine protease
VIPLRDANPNRSAAVSASLLLAVNAAVFAYQSWLDPGAFHRFIARHGLVPVDLVELHDAGVLLKALTGMFLHGSWLHVALNLWFLIIFANVVERTLGRGRFICLYLASGLAGFALQVLIDPMSENVLIGSSGAVAGVLGAHIKLGSHSRVLALTPLPREIPSVYFVAGWFVFQLAAGFFEVMGPAPGGITFFASVGGFIAGSWLVGALRPAPNTTRGFRRPEYY